MLPFFPQQKKNRILRNYCVVPTKEKKKEELLSGLRAKPSVPPREMKWRFDIKSLLGFFTRCPMPHEYSGVANYK